jgi:hypothetical protein
MICSSGARVFLPTSRWQGKVVGKKNPASLSEAEKYFWRRLIDSKDFDLSVA